MLKFISFENLLKLTKKSKILQNVLLNDTLRYISTICFYPRKSIKLISNPQSLIEKYLELVKEDDAYAKNLLNYFNNN